MWLQEELLSLVRPDTFCFGGKRRAAQGSNKGCSVLYVQGPPESWNQPFLWKSLVSTGVHRLLYHCGHPA